MGFVDPVMNEKMMVRLSSKSSVGRARGEKQDVVLWMTWELRLKKTRSGETLLHCWVLHCLFGDPCQQVPLPLKSVIFNPRSGELEIRVQFVWVLCTCVSRYFILEVPI